MNITLWIFQVLLALHTAIGAVWKFSNSEQTIASFKAMPHALWMALIGIELLCCVGLIIPVVNKTLGNLAPVAAICIALEMLLFCGLHLTSGETNNGPLIYWLMVAIICSFIAYGRLQLAPLY